MLLFKRLQNAEAFRNEIGLSERLADRETLREEERVRDAAAHDETVNGRGKVIQNRELRGDLGAGNDRHQRMTGFLNSCGQRFDLTGQQRTRAGALREVRHAFRRRLSAVRRAERVIHVDIAERRVLAGEVFVVLLFADIEAAVFEHHNVTRFNRDTIHPVAHERHFGAKELGEAVSHVDQALSFGRNAFLRAAEVAHHHHRGTGPQRHLDRQNRRREAGLVRDAARFIVRGVQIASDQHPFSRKLSGVSQFLQCLNPHVSLRTNGCFNG